MEYTEKFIDGVFSGRGFVENGQKEGNWYFFYETGELKQEIEYKHGIEHGAFKLFHKNGLPAIETTIVQGQTTGFWREYYENGNIQEEGEYINDEYFPINFWDEHANQLLKDGNGKKIIIYGAYDGPNNVYEQYFEGGRFIREVKIQGWTYLGFRPTK